MQFATGGESIRTEWTATMANDTRIKWAARIGLTLWIRLLALSAASQNTPSAGTSQVTTQPVPRGGGKMETWLNLPEIYGGRLFRATGLAL